MTWREYSQKEVHWPYLLELESGGGHLYYFGAKHTFDPADPQLQQIEKAWGHFTQTWHSMKADFRRATIVTCTSSGCWCSTSRKGGECSPWSAVRMS